MVSLFLAKSSDSDTDVVNDELLFVAPPPFRAQTDIDCHSIDVLITTDVSEPESCYFASTRDKRQGVGEGLRTCDPGHGCGIATTRKDPSASAGVAVEAKRPLVIRWRTFLPSPDREGIPLEFIDIVEGIAGRAIETRFDVQTRLFSKWTQMSNDLKAADSVAVVLKINMLQEEKAPFHPFVGHLALCLAGEVPRPDQYIQTFQIRMRRSCLVGSLSVGVLLRLM